MKHDYKDYKNAFKKGLIPCMSSTIGLFALIILFLYLLNNEITDIPLLVILAIGIFILVMLFYITVYLADLSARNRWNAIHNYREDRREVARRRVLSKEEMEGFFPPSDDNKSAFKEIQVCVTQDSFDGPGQEICGMSVGGGMLLTIGGYKEFRERIRKHGKKPEEIGCPWDPIDDKKNEVLYLQAESSSGLTMITIRFTREQLKSLQNYLEKT